MIAPIVQGPAPIVRVNARDKVKGEFYPKPGEMTSHTSTRISAHRCRAGARARLCRLPLFPSPETRL
jgi:hypothetical protein